MGTNEPTAGTSGDEGQGAAGDPYGGYTQYPSGPSYSGYREGVHGEPVPENAWQDPSGATSEYPQGPYPGPYPGQDPAAGYPSPYPPYGGPPGAYPYPPPGQYPQPYPAYRPTNGMAVASLVLGIIWIYWLGSILALIFGYMARKQIRERGEGGDGLAIAGIVLGWIGVGALVLFIVVFALAGLGSEFS